MEVKGAEKTEKRREEQLKDLQRRSPETGLVRFRVSNSV